MMINIRNEEEKDYRIVEELTREAFWNLHFPGCDEHYLVNQMRAHKDFIREMAFVAEVNGQIVGNIMYTRSYIINSKGEKAETLTFGPLSVLPSFQRQSIGTALINHTVSLAQARNVAAVIIYGNPANYVKHGFKNGIDWHVSDMSGKYPIGLLVLSLKDDILLSETWKFHCSDVYDIRPEEIDEFDKTFSHKEKSYQYSQTLFSMMIRAFLV